MGGTGKTTYTCWLSRSLATAGRRPAVILRGYGAKASGPRIVTAGGEGGEEARLLADSVSNFVVVEAANRWLGARLAIVERGCDTIILDDGFQHSAIQRNLDIVLVDALSPWGNGTLLPAGLLREPKQSLGRAHTLVLTRADLVDSVTCDSLLDEMARLAPKAVLAAAAHHPIELRRVADNRRSGLDELVGKQVGLCSAIGNPLAFERTVHSLGAGILGHRVFRDHHRYSRDDLNSVLERFQQAEIVLCTSKDAVRLQPLAAEASDTRLWALEVEWRFLSGEEAIARQIAEVLHE
jgi:tetraacyldisaccharide 4'-kinase